ncbi:allergen [Aspergillus sp. HF37]|nr:allergen [Aspergillus sp. HF37]
MYFTKSMLLLAAVTSGATARLSGHERRQAAVFPSPTISTSPSPASSSSGSNAGWTATPPSGNFIDEVFGESTGVSKGSGITYKGNTGIPWGSNIQEVSEDSAHLYKFVAQFTGQNTEPWTVVFWNKYGPNGNMAGWYGHSALTLTMNPGDTKYVAFQDNTRGGWSAAKGDEIPTGENGEYIATWGEFDVSNDGNNGWSAFDVSAIQAQHAGIEPQGMKICQATGGDVCSTITTGAEVVDNAYTADDVAAEGIGANIPGGAPQRFAVVIDYSGN